MRPKAKSLSGDDIPTIGESKLSHEVALKFREWEIRRGLVTNATIRIRNRNADRLAKRANGRKR